ncbi:MAG: Coenzyme F420 hydrogenase/dehydrogenase, beta subunit C-terminal domain [Bacteroides thetaiotaomicron]|nr:Coenzyme F420 hydrogenase/dehydrogenase, beta subunit C-terminal domain [Bacteroides thetaiotaomicron]
MELLEKSLCCGCSACSSICPVDAINMRMDGEGFSYPYINQDTCRNCGLCRSVCPVTNLNTSPKEYVKKAYAAFHNDRNIISNSSSGGIFSALAVYVLQQGGCVFGATYNDTFTSVHHIKIKSLDELCLLRGSKYLQSEIGYIYRTVKDCCVNDDKLVLFTGTPCEVEGLCSYLGKSYDNLICVDIICHGVPSGVVWDAYIKLLEEKYKAKTISVDFRNKRKGWENYSVDICFQNGKRYHRDHEKDLFMNCFLSDMILRPSCYNCSFKKINRVSDITLADFWGVDRICPSMHNPDGTSLVVVNSRKGADILEQIESEITLKEVDFDGAMEWNASYISSAPKPDNRDAFMGNEANLNSPKLWKLHLPKLPLYQHISSMMPRKVIRLIKRILSRN